MEQENKAILNLEDLKKNYLLSFKGKVYVFFLQNWISQLLAAYF